MRAKIGVIGGSGLYSMPGFEAHEEVAIETPWGSPSDKYVVGTLAGKPVAFLARHGRGHRLSPSELNFRANVYGMKMRIVRTNKNMPFSNARRGTNWPIRKVCPYHFARAGAYNMKTLIFRTYIDVSLKQRRT